MSYYSIKIDNFEIAKRAKAAESFVDRSVGLMFSESLGEKDALIIDPCRSIHTFFMNYSIDVIFINKTNSIVKVLRNIKPWRVTPIYFRANKVIEFKGGSLPENIAPGVKLEIKCIN